MINKTVNRYQTTHSIGSRALVSIINKQDDRFAQHGQMIADRILLTDKYYIGLL